MGYRPPTLTRGPIQNRTLHVIPPRRIPSRSRFVNVMRRVYPRFPYPTKAKSNIQQRIGVRVVDAATARQL